MLTNGSSVTSEQTKLQLKLGRRILDVDSKLNLTSAIYSSMKSLICIFKALLIHLGLVTLTVASEITPLPAGSFPVASTNLEIADGYKDISDDEMHDYLLGDRTLWGSSKYLADILKYPQSAWTTDVKVPNDAELYGPVSNETLKVVSYITYPSEPSSEPNRYDFPYQSSNFGSFEHMLGPDETPTLSKVHDKYPLVILSHGSEAHGIYDIEHANMIARHGYIVAVINYGENRTKQLFSRNSHLQFLRPLITKAVIDSVLNSTEFGPHVDRDNIAISGFSFGGFTALATSGGKVNGESKTQHHPLVSAAVIAAPWTGGVYRGETVYAFGTDNAGLNNINIPIMTIFGSDDEITRSDFILPAVKQLKGSTYVVEFLNQTHAFEDGSWEDRTNWEILFLNAYLKDDEQALGALRVGTEMQGGNGDRQLFEYQNLLSRNE